MTAQRRLQTAGARVTLNHCALNSMSMSVLRCSPNLRCLGAQPAVPTVPKPPECPKTFHPPLGNPLTCQTHYTFIKKGLMARKRDWLDGLGERWAGGEREFPTKGKLAMNGESRSDGRKCNPSPLPLPWPLAAKIDTDIWGRNLGTLLKLLCTTELLWCSNIFRGVLN